MTTIGRRLIRVLRPVIRVAAIQPRQNPTISLSSSSSSSLSSLSSISSSSTTTSDTTGQEEELNIQSLDELQNLLNVPVTGNRGEEFDKALQLEYEFFKFNGQQVCIIWLKRTMKDCVWDAYARE